MSQKINLECNRFMTVVSFHCWWDYTMKMCIFKLTELNDIGFEYYLIT